MDQMPRISMLLSRSRFPVCNDIFITEQQVSRHEVIDILYSYLVYYFACKRSSAQGKTKTQSAAPRESNNQRLQ